MKFNQLLKFFGLVILIYSCETSNNQTNESVSIIGTWNLIEFNDNANEVYCPKTLEITTDLYTENEYGGETCENLFSFSSSYTFDSNTLEIINPDIQNTSFNIILLTENELTLETTTPNANQTLKFTYEKLE